MVFLQDSNPRTTVLKVVAKANNLDLNVVDVNPEQLTAEHLKASPLGKIPAFVGEDGFALSEVVALAIYRRSTPSFSPRLPGPLTCGSQCRFVS